MDLVLDYADEYIFDATYAYFLPAPDAGGSKFAGNATLAAGAAVTRAASSWARDNILRQTVSLFVLSGVAALALYFLLSSLSYFILYDKRLEHHPRFLPRQKYQEIVCSVLSVPVMDVLTIPWFLGEVRGHSLLYTDVSERGWAYLVFSAVWFLVFTDFLIYWIHRIEHHPSIYKYIHKPHHKWIIPTPFAALAFHPLDGYAQSLPYHVFVYLFPMHRLLYLGMFGFVQIWTVFIHDADMISDHFMERFLNSPAHHTLHHIYFTCNYGQYFTWADKAFDSHRQPIAELDPLIASLKNMQAKGLIDENHNPIPDVARKQQ